MKIPVDAALLREALVLLSECFEWAEPHGEYYCQWCEAYARDMAGIEHLSDCRNVRIRNGLKAVLEGEC